MKHQLLYSLAKSGIQIVTDVKNNEFNTLELYRSDDFLKAYYVDKSLSRLEFAMTFDEINHLHNTGVQYSEIISELEALFGKYLYTFFSKEYSAESLTYICEELSRAAYQAAMQADRSARSSYSYCRRSVVCDIIAKYRAAVVDEESDVTDARLAAMARISLPFYALNCLFRPDADFESSMHRSWAYGMKAYNECC